MRHPEQLVPGRNYLITADAAKKLFLNGMFEVLALLGGGQVKFLGQGDPFFRRAVELALAAENTGVGAMGKAPDIALIDVG